MEANIVVKAQDLTPDFADGICKVFSKDAVLHIKVEYSLNVPSSADAPKRRGPKPKAQGSAPATPGKKRGRKPGPKAAAKDANPGPKKRGRKPKLAAE
jgi:hypothetical protein